MKNKENKIIYIGKAKLLKDRVNQYFGSQKNMQEKVIRMVMQVYDFDFIITDSEFEALVLECSLIKQHMPKYNILLKDDKGYNYIKITNEKYPRITSTKQILDDGATYIGPYTSSLTVKNAVNEVIEIFKLPTCKLNFIKKNNKLKPCLNYYIKKCCAPCLGKINIEEYNDYIKDAKEFLNGNGYVSISDLKNEMANCAENLNFEKAARIRDRINTIKKINEKQKVIASKIKEQDVVSVVIGVNKIACFVVLKFLDGRLYDSEEFILKDIGEIQQAKSEFIKRYYTLRNNNIPKQITIDGDIEDKEIIQEWLSEKAGKRVNIVIPKRGEQLKLINMCTNNAAEKLVQNIKKGTSKEAIALDELTKLLGLKAPPEYIEAYDISNLGSNDMVAGMVVFENGIKQKKLYKKFKIKWMKEQDDYAAMSEVMFRRLEEYEKLKGTGEGFGRLPDLILLDGGKGHVSTIKNVINNYNVDIPVFGMVKDEKHRTRALVLEDKVITININRKVFTLISNIQEEVHRFTIGYHRNLRKKSTFSSNLTLIKGVGNLRAKELLKYFSTIEKISKASIEELEKVPKINKEIAKNIYNYFNT